MNLAIIQARLNSTRLPGKALRELGGKPVLRHVIDRVRKAQTLDRIVVATPGNGGQVIAGHCASWGVECVVDFETPENDVLRRFVSITERIEEAEIVIRVCGDAPLIRPDCIDALAAAIRDEPRYKRTYDYAAYRLHYETFGRPVPTVVLPIGYFPEAVTVDALRRLDRTLMQGDHRREHVTMAIYQRPRHFDCRYLDLPEWYTPETPHAAIDTEEDLERVEEVVSGEW